MKSADLGVDDVFRFADVTTEEGGWLVVNTVTSPDSSAAASDAVSFSSAIDGSYERLVTEEDLPAIEQDLYPEEVVRILFLAVDDTPALVLQKCVVKMSHGQSEKGKMVDSFSEWAHVISEHSWKVRFLESLAVIGRKDVLDILGCTGKDIKVLENPVHLSSLKVSLNRVCCSLRQREMMEIVRYVSERHLPDRAPATFPDGVLIKQLLELHILFWMQEGIMDMMNLTVLVDALEFIKRPELKDVLMGRRSPPSSSIPYYTEHSKVVSLPSLPGLPDSFVYPNDKGICVVFNQEQFNCLDDRCPFVQLPYHGQRLGSSMDAKNLERVFENFGCKTKIFRNVTGSQIETCLKNLAGAHDLGEFDFLVVCFLSHGITSGDGRQMIFSSDCRKLFIDDLISAFEGDKCRGMRGKMKMIITQSCQGDGTLPPYQADGPSAPTTPSSSLLRGSAGNAQSDFLFCQATTPGNKAYRDPNRGSFYIMRLCEVLESRGHLEEVSLCIKDVHNLLIKQPILLGEERLLCSIQPQVVDRTQGRFRFKRVDRRQ